MTPFEKLGYSTGDLFEVTENDGFTKGSKVRLFMDTGEYLVKFKLVQGHFMNAEMNNQVWRYVHIGNVVKVGESESTPCEELGYKVGDLFRVTKADIFVKGSLVRLSKDDNTDTPFFELIEGAAVDESTALSGTACEELSNVEKVNLTPKKHSHYFKPVEHLTEVDVYRVCDIFKVDDHSGATQHAIKKLLLPGQRGGGKSTRKDIKEAIDTLTRKLEMRDEDERNDKDELPTSRI